MQIAAFNLTDSQAGSVTFTPMIKNNLLVEYRDTSASKSSLYPMVSCGLRPAKGSVARKVVLKITKPFEYTENDVVKTADISCFIDVVVPSVASESDIQDLIEFASGAIKVDQFTDTIENGAFPY